MGGDPLREGSRGPRPALPRGAAALSPSDDIVRAIEPVVRCLEHLGVAHYIGGSVASSALGVSRTTMDVDLLADLEDEHVAPFAAALRGEYYLSEEALRRAVADRSCANLVHLATMLKIDLFVAKRTSFDRASLERATPMVLEPGTRPFALASPEDIVLNKLAWFRRGGEASERQWRDVVGVLRVRGGSLDRAHLARWAGILGVADLLHRALGEAGP